ncbi:alpha/beta hydrolase [Staphylococcus pseudintermedius]|uniref:alpha/beta hydrolase n=1 Tax=Staphylococcus pseudintermedius TaxID=283734 RepID=UPI001036130B|nr:alpha/beta hydrolase [Staphylococcus pseudintermedius]EGQ0309657.1 alpha/beta hydrolase [Staphylococcus pseudintermedius]EGQ0315809.1 alpha/beta hydrolase [Staphylococcus pseudintermedius]EGQ0362096.1 alpha/beta hydrolase [Staphylococcus pseudintermedius]EGQ1294708.1 alpha/beta hydrolase fold domain-containing protein [Staphylococcus pseudintermedius]EGQ1643791.1 alpha/beta hydrolase [Staphylococcus pseudintermedius]
MTEKSIIETFGSTFKHTGRWYPTTNADAPLGTLLYIHGGGLVFGKMDDLPEAYMNILRRSFNVFTVPYRFIPEAKLTDIVEDVTAAYDHIAKQQDSPIYVMGRSSGAYLASLLATLRPVQGLILFYGYYDFKHAAFHRLPTDQQHIASMLNDKLEIELTQDEPISNEETPIRYLLYLYYRHRDIWLTRMGKHIDLYELQHSDLKTLPPTFLAHCTFDPDVPFEYSQTMAHHIPQHHLEAIPKHAHDFDRQVTEDNINLYQKATNFLWQQQSQ